MVLPQALLVPAMGQWACELRCLTTQLYPAILRAATQALSVC